MISIGYTRTYNTPIEVKSPFTGQPMSVSQQSKSIEIDDSNLSDTQREQLKGLQGFHQISFDHEPTLDDVLKLAAAKAQEKAERLAKEQAEREAKALAAQQKLEAASQIEWNENGRAVVNLHDKIEIVSGVEFDHRYKNWIKRVDAVDTTKTNGYAFEGDLVGDRTIEVTNTPTVFLVAGTSGSRKHATTHYRIVVLRDGKLEATDIQADNRDSGWALIIRDRVAALLKELQGADAPDEFAALREAIQTNDVNVTVNRELLAKLLALV